ncbi:MAG: hypothetical protein HY231_10610 [Acidobacteria bacterium]|nr:hypothetical protein [Acidobacteriota bacterium]
MNDNIPRPNLSSGALMLRGGAAAVIGIVIGWLVLYLLHTRRTDGQLVLWGNLMNNLAYWIFIDFPFIAVALVITGIGIGWLMSKIKARRWLTKPLGLVVGMVVGAILSMTAAAVVARIFDLWTLKEFQLVLYGYYFVKSAAVIGATSGAIAGAYTGVMAAKAAISDRWLGCAPTAQQ